jgi:gamma-butyrobetaine dioxygenase
MTPSSVGDLLSLYEDEAAHTAYDEVVTELEHALQAGALAATAGAPPALVAAALLHDVGHLILRDHRPLDEALERDHRHEQAGATCLARLFPPEVTEPVRWHVAAKRYLCAVEPGYHDHLSASSVRSLGVQGGPMTDDEVAQFERLPGFDGAVRVRRWDDAAKLAGQVVPDLASYRPLLETLAEQRADSARG